MIDENRLKHSLAVAHKMVEIGKNYGFDKSDLDDLFLLGMVHDIGYEFGSNINHAYLGGNLLMKNGYHHWSEVSHHGDPLCIHNSLYLHILNAADMQIDSKGQDVGYEGRLGDIATRYGVESEVYKTAKLMVEKLTKEVLSLPYYKYNK